MCFWTHLMLSPGSTGLLCVLPQSFYSSTKQAQENHGWVWMIFYCTIKHFMEGSDSPQSWKTKERQRKAWKSRRGKGEVSTCGWHRIIADLKLALPLIYHLALVISLNHGLFSHLKNEHSLHLPHKDVMRAEVWNCH